MTKRRKQPETAEQKAARELREQKEMVRIFNEFLHERRKIRERLPDAFKDETASEPLPHHMSLSADGKLVQHFEE